MPDVDLEKVKRKQELEKELEKQRSLQAEYVPLKGNYHIRPFLTDIISSKVDSNMSGDIKIEKIDSYEVNVKNDKKS